MNIEAYNYTVVTTVLGMLVVFLSLGALSLLMVALKAFGEGPAGRGGAPGGRAAAERAAGRRAAGRRAAGNAAARAESPAPAEALKSAGQKRPEPKNRGAEEERQPPPWLTAAIAAYLAGEERDGPTAEPWMPEFNHFDPWLGPGRATRRPDGQQREQQG